VPGSGSAEQNRQRRKTYQVDRDEQMPDQHDITCSNARRALRFGGGERNWDLPPSEYSARIAKLSSTCLCCDRPERKKRFLLRSDTRLCTLNRPTAGIFMQARDLLCRLHGSLRPIFSAPFATYHSIVCQGVAKSQPFDCTLSSINTTKMTLGPSS
jgi:hypothetical protein